MCISAVSLGLIVSIQPQIAVCVGKHEIYPSNHRVSDTLSFIKQMKVSPKKETTQPTDNSSVSSVFV